MNLRKQLANAKIDALVKEKNMSKETAIEKVWKEMEALQTKADEVMYSTNTGKGEELIPTSTTTDRVVELMESDSGLLQLLAPGRVDSDELSLNSEVHVAGKQWDFISRSEWTTWAYRPDTPDNFFATDKVTINQKGLESSVWVSKKLSNYSVAEIEDIILRKFATTAVRTIENVVINGDQTTAATGNINSDDADPTTILPKWARNATLLYTNSLRFATLNPAADPLVDNIDVSGAVSAQDLFDALKRFRYNSGTVLEDDIAMVMDSKSYYTLMNDENFRDYSINVDASSLTSRVFNFRWIQYAVSDQIAPSQGNWRVSSVETNNDKWTIIFFRKNVIQHGFGAELEAQIQPKTSIRQWLIAEAVMDFGFSNLNKLWGFTQPDILALRNITN